MQLFPRAFKFGRHEVAPPAEFGSLVSGVAFLQHVTAQYLLVVAQLPKLISLAPESTLKQAEDAVLLDTSALDFEQSLDAMKQIIAKKIGG